MAAPTIRRGCDGLERHILFGQEALLGVGQEPLWGIEARLPKVPDSATEVALKAETTNFTGRNKFLAIRTIASRNGNLKRIAVGNSKKSNRKRKMPGIRTAETLVLDIFQCLPARFAVAENS
jgi:hypothetical protein